MLSHQVPPVKLSTLTYLSFHLERLVMHSTAGLHSPFITISVHDARGRRVSWLAETMKDGRDGAVGAYPTVVEILVRSELSVPVNIMYMM